MRQFPCSKKKALCAPFSYIIYIIYTSSNVYLYHIYVLKAFSPRRGPRRAALPPAGSPYEEALAPYERRVRQAGLEAEDYLLKQGAPAGSDVVREAAALPSSPRGARGRGVHTEAHLALMTLYRLHSAFLLSARRPADLDLCARTPAVVPIPGRPRNNNKQIHNKNISNKYDKSRGGQEDGARGGPGRARDGLRRVAAGGLLPSLGDHRQRRRVAQFLPGRGPLAAPRTLPPPSDSGDAPFSPSDRSVQPVPPSRFGGITFLEGFYKVCGRLISADRPQPSEIRRGPVKAPKGPGSSCGQRPRCCQPAPQVHALRVRKAFGALLALLTGTPFGRPLTYVAPLAQRRPLDARLARAAPVVAAPSARAPRPWRSF